MRKDNKRLFVVGDRVLVTPIKGEERTRVGLYLPSAAVERTEVQSGRIVEVGPGIPVPPPADVSEEPWKIEDASSTRFVALEAKVGDYALFLRKAAIEIEFEGETYLIVPHGALLVLVRSEELADDSTPEFRAEDFDI